MMATDTYQKVIGIALDEFSAANAGGASEWEYNDNKAKVNASRDFILFLNKMVLDRIEQVVEEEDDGEPQHAPA